MRIKLFNELLLLLIVFSQLSCGYSIVEGDKHKDIPVFPSSSNMNVVFKKNNKYKFEQIYFDAKKLYFISEDFLVITNRELVQKHKIDIDMEYVHINEFGDVYSVETIGESQKTVGMKKFISPNYKFINLELKEFVLPNNTAIFEKIEDNQEGTIRLKIEKDSLFSKWNYVDSLTLIEESRQKKEMQDKISLLFTDSLNCVYRLDRSNYLFKYNSSELAVFFDSDDVEIMSTATKEFPKCKNVKQLNDWEEIVEAFDESVIGNKSTGNHYVGGYYPIMYYYFNVILFEDTVKFKTQHSGSVFILHKTSEKIDLIIDNELYNVIKNKE